MQDTERKDEMGAPKIQAESYQFIEFDGQKWRFKGYRAGIIDAVLGLQARGESPSVLAQDLHLPLIAVEEAIQFVQSHPEAVIEHQRRMLKIANEHSRR